MEAFQLFIEPGTIDSVTVAGAGYFTPSLF